MANIDAPMGFVPMSHVNGDNIVYARTYSIASAYPTALFGGDPVVMTGTGRQIALAAPGTVDPLGVFAGCKYTDPTGDIRYMKYWPAAQVATDIEAWVWVDKEIIYQIQCDALNEADVGLLADWAAGAGGNTMTGISSHSLVASAGATSLQAVHILGLVPDNEQEYGTFANAMVRFARPGEGGV